MVLGGSSSGGGLGTAILDLRANAGPLDRGLERSEKNVRRSTGRMGKSVKVVGLACRWSMIMSVVSCSVKMSVYERTDVDEQGAGEGTGVERSARG